MDELAINGGSALIKDNAGFTWPRITPEAEKAVVDQLHTSISIYDKSGIIEEFENKFAFYHGREKALLSNSGTSAIFSMFEAIELMPGDEVICPVYTFHATISPITYTGATPVFADCDKYGNVSYESVRSLINENTRAVIVTHMWGAPVRDIELIKALCEEKSIYLLEDCSHAHGARLNSKPVGSFGTAAAWSLQGQKTITGGEGGVMLTDNEDIYYRALIQGHYNKRPKSEIPSDHRYYKFYLTGMGLKLRAHPLAIALASQQFNQLDEFLRQRQSFAEMITEALSPYPFLELPLTTNQETQNSRYAYIIKYVPEKAHGVSREEFVDALLAEGLTEVDIPGSTGLINDLPLFVDTHELMPRLYQPKDNLHVSYPNAELFITR